MTVNGPEDEGLDWDQIIWPVHEEHVRRPTAQDLQGDAGLTA